MGDDRKQSFSIPSWGVRTMKHYPMYILMILTSCNSKIDNNFTTKSHLKLPNPTYFRSSGAMTYNQEKGLREVLALKCTDGSASSCAHLGYMLQHGQGGTADTKKAMLFYTKACKMGFTLSCDERIIQ
jgi:hypothetical protein